MSSKNDYTNEINGIHQKCQLEEAIDIFDSWVFSGQQIKKPK